MNSKVSEFLKLSSVGLDSTELLRSRTCNLLGISEDLAIQLTELMGIVTIYDLATNPIFNAALTITTMEQDSALFEKGFVPKQYFNISIEKWEGISEVYISSLRGVDNKTSEMLKTHAGITTIREMAFWSPFKNANTILQKELGTSVEDDDGIPDELHPSANQFPTEKIYFNTVVLDSIKSRSKLQPLTDQISLDEVADKGFKYSAIAEGAILNFEQSWYFKGLSLGHLLHSLALAPGESTRIALIDWTRSLAGKLSESTNEQDSLQQETSHGRALSEITNAVASETQSGFSRMTSESTQSNLGVAAGIAGFAPGVLGGLGISASKSKSKTVATGFTSSSGDRNVSANLSQRILDTTQQAASSTRNRYAASVKEVSQNEKESLSTRVVTNYNHMHALSLQYFEVVQLFKVAVKLHHVDKCIFIPFVLPDVTNLDIVRKYRGILAQVALNDNIRTLLQNEQVVRIVPSFRPAQFHSERGMKIALDVLNKARAESGLLLAASPFDEWKLPPETIVHGYTLRCSLPLRNYRVNSGTIEENPNLKYGHYSTTCGWGHSGCLASDLRKFEIEIDTSKGFPAGSEIFFELNLKYRGKDFSYSSRIDLDKIFVGYCFDNQWTWVNVSETIPPPPYSDLLDHLENNRTYYSQKILENVPPEDIAAVLSTYGYEIGGQSLPLLELVDPTPVACFGNMLGFRMRVPSISDISKNKEDNYWVSHSQQWDSWLLSRGIKVGSVKEDLVPIPSGGVFAEAVLGRANCAEKLDITRFWNWQDSPIPILPPEIAPLQSGSRSTSENLSTGALNNPIISVATPTSLPEPTGLTAALNTLSQSNLFRDMSGIAAVSSLSEQTTSAAKEGAASAASNAAQVATAAMSEVGKIAQKQEETKAAAVKALSDYYNTSNIPQPKNITEEGAKLNYKEKTEKTPEIIPEDPSSIQTPVENLIVSDASEAGSSNKYLNTLWDMMSGTIPQQKPNEKTNLTEFFVKNTPKLLNLTKYLIKYPAKLFFSYHEYHLEFLASVLNAWLKYDEADKFIESVNENMKNCKKDAEELSNALSQIPKDPWGGENGFLLIVMAPAYIKNTEFVAGFNENLDRYLELVRKGLESAQACLKATRIISDQKQYEKLKAQINGLSADSKVEDIFKKSCINKVNWLMYDASKLDNEVNSMMHEHVTNLKGYLSGAEAIQHLTPEQ